MQYCIDLALRAGKATKSNPMVGAILVYQNRIIGEGYHEKFGEGHAERNAINQALSQYPNLVKKAMLYVTLEPCSFTGKTPPCKDYILEHSIKKVIVGCLDPNPKVAGSSIEFLRNKGVEVSVGILETQCKQLISKFRANLAGRPFIMLKWAQSADFFMGKRDKQIWISNEYAKIFVHKLRSEVEGIWVGTNTAIIDNPSLTTRNYNGDNPVRIVPDFKQVIPMEHNIFNDEALTIVITNESGRHRGKHITELIQKDDELIDILKNLYKNGIHSMLIEGGKKTLESFIEADLWDEAYVITANKKLETGIKSPTLMGIKIWEKRLNSDHIVKILNDSAKIS